MAVTFTVEITELAEQDLEDALEYIADNSSYESAKKALRKILDAIYKLEKMPSAYSRVQEIIGFGRHEYRQIIAAKHRIMFTVEEVNTTVYVVRIIHVKRDPDFVINALS